jgi:hypothetical protein
MSLDKYQQLIDQLLAKTERGSLEWRETAEPDTFLSSFSNYSVILTRREHAPNYFVHIISILNSEGKKVDTFCDDMGWDPGYKQQLTDLYERARRQALGADKALDEILTQLKEAY